jgi:parallel beta-helix repeat protein
MFIPNQPPTYLHLRGLAPLLVLALVLCAGCADDAVAPGDTSMGDHLAALGVAAEDLEGADMNALEASIDFEAVAEVARVSESDAEPAAVRGRPVQLVRPGDSIQDAIDAAPAGGIVLIRRGTYEIEESITITKSLRLVGLGGPGAVVIAEKSGLTERPRNGIFVGSQTSAPVQDVSVVNVTVRGFTGNGILMVNADGFLLHRVITDQLGGPDPEQDGGAYGLFPVRSRNGLITHCTATRADDSGIYVGQSVNVAVVHNEAYGNVIGLEAENVKQTVWAHNRAYDNAAGMLAILLPIDPTDEYPIVETFAEQLYVAHNRFTDNNGPNFAPGGLAGSVPSGTGLLVFGYDDSVITRNRVSGNEFVGIGLASAVTLLAAAGRFEDLPLLATTIPQGPHPDNVRITRNRVTDNGSGEPLEVGLPDGSTIAVPAADLIWDKPIIDLLGMDPGFPFGDYGEGNCWEGNTYESSFPDTLPSCNGGV